MSIERLIPPIHPLSGPMADRGDPQALLQRMQAELQDQHTLPIDDQQTLPIEDPRQAMDRFVRKWFADDFMRTMLFEDEEKTGIKAEEWS